MTLRDGATYESIRLSASPPDTASAAESAEPVECGQRNNDMAFVVRARRFDGQWVRVSFEDLGEILPGRYRTRWTIDGKRLLSDYLVQECVSPRDRLANRYHQDSLLLERNGVILDGVDELVWCTLGADRVIDMGGPRDRWLEWTPEMQAREIERVRV